MVNSQDFRLAPSDLVYRIAFVGNKHEINDNERPSDEKIALVSDFLKFIAPDSNFNKSEYSFLSSVIVNLDEESQSEVVALVGLNSYSTILVVFKRIQNQWLMIYKKPVYVWYSSPEINIVKTSSVNKVFFVRQLYNQGTSIYNEHYQFFKLINNHVHQCLEIVNDAHIDGWGLYLYQKVKSEFSFSNSNKDEILVTYDYDFYPGAVYDPDAPWVGHVDLSFVRGKETINYIWDSVTFSYKPIYSKNKKSLNQEKISCFGNFANDSLFVRAFSIELNAKLKSDMTEAKEILSKYLSLAKKHVTVAAPTDE
jgi:hypothetical protein